MWVDLRSDWRREFACCRPANDCVTIGQSNGRTVTIRQEQSSLGYSSEFYLSTRRLEGILVVSRWRSGSVFFARSTGSQRAVQP